MRDWFAAKRTPPVSTYEKLGNREPHRIEAEDDTPANGNFGGKADWKLAAKAVKQAPKDPSVINQAFAKGGLHKGALKRPGAKFVRSQMMSKDSALAFDHGLLFNYSNGLRTRPQRDGLAFDFKSVRSFSADGYLHVENSNISKAAINPYLGREIPGWEELGLDPDKIYKLFRDPQELAKAASTFNNVPLLSKHVPVSSTAFPSELIMGSTATDANFSPPYLTNGLVVWTEEGIRGIESEKKKELSSAYRYTPDMVSGNYQGEKYDGVMRDIIGNHVALVEEGRAGPDVMVGDSMESIRMAKKPTVKMSRQAAIAVMVVSSALRPKLAADSKLNLLPLFKDVTGKNFKEMKPAILKGLRSQLKLRPVIAADSKKPMTNKLAMDATIGEVAELLDMIESHGVENDLGVNPAQAAAVAPAAEVAGTPPPIAAPSPPMKPGGMGGSEEGMGGLEESLEGEEAAEGEEDSSMGSKAKAEGLLKGKVDDATLAAVMACFENGEADETDTAEDSEGGEGKLEELGAAGDKLLEEDPNAEKGTATGAGSPGAGSGSAEDEDMDEMEAADAVKMPLSGDKKKAMDNPPPFKGMPKPGGKMVGDKKPVTFGVLKTFKVAQDTAIRNAVAAERKNQASIRDAERFVRPWVGEVSADITFDSAEHVFRATLESLGMDSAELDDIHPSAYRALVQSQQKPNERREASSQRRSTMGMDSARSSAKSYAERFPDTKRIKHM